tara:strand:+ start:2342 stop:2860 length:519 start_codon:yes stop_codon:yes gene_type:complete
MKKQIVKQLNQKFPAFNFDISLGDKQVIVSIVKGIADFSEVGKLLALPDNSNEDVKPAERNVFWKKVKNQGFFLKKFPEEVGVSISDIEDAVKLLVKKNVKVLIKLGSISGNKSYVQIDIDSKICWINRDYDYVSDAKKSDDKDVFNRMVSRIKYYGNNANKRAIKNLSRDY